MWESVGRQAGLTLRDHWGMPHAACNHSASDSAPLSVKAVLIHRGHQRWAASFPAVPCNTPEHLAVNLPQAHFHKSLRKRGWGSWGLASLSSAWLGRKIPWSIPWHSWRTSALEFWLALNGLPEPFPPPRGWLKLEHVGLAKPQ